MPTKFILPESLSPKSLDRLLARGWYRMGPAVFTCDFLVQEATFGSTVWTRLPLADWKPGRNLRRLMARNRRRFRVETRPPLDDDNSERIYQRYRKLKPWVTSDTLAQHLRADLDSDVFDTHEIAIYDGQRLAGFSHFDLGDKSLASLLGAYDPEYAKHSLGLWSMLLEIEEGIARGADYFYGGYVVPGYPALDYKHRVGALEFFAPETGMWRPFEELDVERLPAERVNRKLAEIEATAPRFGLELATRLNPEYSLAFVDGFVDFVPFPKFLDICNVGLRVFIAWDHVRELYVIAEYREPLRFCGPARENSGAEGLEELWEMTGRTEVARSAEGACRLAKAAVEGRPPWNPERPSPRPATPTMPQLFVSLREPDDR